MPRFVLIDPSIKHLGGHHFEYAGPVLAAAARVGFAPVLAANRGFAPPPGFAVPTHPVFRYEHYFHPDDFWWLVAPVRVLAFVDRMVAGGRGRPTSPAGPAPPPPPAGPPTAFRQVRAAGERAGFRLANAQRGRQFSRDVAALARVLGLADGDVVFIPTLSAVELAGLGRYLRGAVPGPVWHLLFRYNLYRGREADYDAEDRDRPEVRVVRAAFRRFAADARGHQVFWYTDTDRLSGQYDRVGVGPFKPLPIPQTPADRVAPVRPPGAGPLVAVSVGGARREKGFHLLPGLVDDLWADCVAPGRLRFRVQSYFHGGMRGEPGVPEAIGRLAARPADRVELIDRPLGSDEYFALLLSADICLMLYDPPPYYARSSHILAESLAAGIPVVVPAGTWLSDQIAGPAAAHRGAVRAAARSLGTVTVPGGGAGERTREVELPAGATAVWGEADPPGGSSGDVVVARVEQLGGGPPRTRHVIDSFLIPVAPGADRLRLTVRTAAAVRLEFLSTPGPVPSSAVGVVYADPADAAEVVREVIDHYPHYRRTAGANASLVRAWNNADRLVAELRRPPG